MTLLTQGPLLVIWRSVTPGSVPGLFQFINVGTSIHGHELGDPASAWSYHLEPHVYSLAKPPQLLSLGIPAVPPTQGYP